jgi:hypothetical protein
LIPAEPGSPLIFYKREGAKRPACLKCALMEIFLGEERGLVGKMRIPVETPES